MRLLRYQNDSAALTRKCSAVKLAP